MASAILHPVGVKYNTGTYQKLTFPYEMKWMKGKVRLCLSIVCGLCLELHSYKGDTSAWLFHLTMQSYTSF